jgi:chondroitin-sulfate-ABC endolyase/exolyase
MDIYFLRGSEAECIRGLQHSLHEETDAPTEGYFEKAYINHGDIVKDGKYEYMLFMPVTKDEIEFAFDENALEEYSKELPYTVLRHDRSVHGVADHESGTRAFAVFEPGQVDSVVLNSSSAMLMYSASEETMTLSVANPDLAMYEGPSDEVFDKEGKRIERSVYGRKWIDNPCGETCIELTIKGLWEIYDSCGCKVNATAKDGNTTLTFSSTEGRTEEIILKRIML